MTPSKKFGALHPVVHGSQSNYFPYLYVMGYFCLLAFLHQVFKPEFLLSKCMHACMPYTPQLTGCIIIFFFLVVIVVDDDDHCHSIVHGSIPSLRKLLKCSFLIVGDPQWQCIFHSLCQQIYDEITLPLLLMVQQLQAQKHLLFDLLKKKDIEITEYKLEGAQLSRSEW